MITPEQLREWTEAAGLLAPLVFLAVHVVATTAPFPRAVFTFSAGLLFGPALGIGLAVVAATASAGLAFLLVRLVGRNRVAARLKHPRIRAIDRRLARRGWLAVGSLRLIAPVPFWLINYCAALSSIRVPPFLLATLIGILPSTIGAALLGDALTGDTDPVLLVISGICIAIGVVGLIVDARMAAPEKAEEPATATG